MGFSEAAKPIVFPFFTRCVPLAFWFPHMKLIAGFDTQIKIGDYGMIHIMQGDEDLIVLSPRDLDRFIHLLKSIKAKALEELSKAELQEAE